jgi:Holliday junction resolvase RusA-like endonuclease
LEPLFLRHAPRVPFRGPIWLGIKAFFQIPKTIPDAWKSVAPEKNKYKWFEAAALAGEVRPLGRPDWSNIQKHLEDIGTGIFWFDDSQIVGPGPWGGKFYGMIPRYEISIGYRKDMN